MVFQKIGVGAKVNLVNVEDTCGISALLLTRFVEFLEKNGYLLAETSPDVYVICSCCAFELTKKKAAEQINRIRKITQKPIVLFGCFAGVELGNHRNIIRLPSKSIEDADDFFVHKISIKGINPSSLRDDIFIHAPDYVKKYSIENFKRVLVSQGCNHHCSYCNIKGAKGATQSRKFQDIKNDILALLKIKDDEDILLTADDCGSFGSDIHSNIIELLDSIFKLNDKFTVSISYLFPQDLLDYEKEFLRLFRTKRISFACIPIQSGSQRILELMNRGYNIRKVHGVIKEIKKVAPATWLRTHVIINFPSETRKDLVASLAVSEIFDEAWITSYSDHSSTKAYHLGGKFDQPRAKKNVAFVSEYIKRTKKNWSVL